MPVMPWPSRPGPVRGMRNVGSGNAAELATSVVGKGKPVIALAERALSAWLMIGSVSAREKGHR